MVALITKLTSIKSMAPENGGDGEFLRAKALESFLRESGFSDITYYNAPDSRVTNGERPNMVLTVTGESRKVLWIIAHLDTVPAGDLSKWDTPPFNATLIDKKLFGRGCEDNTQGLVSAVFSLMALKACNITPKYTVKLLFTADEEVGSDYGVKWMVENTNAFVKGDEVLIPDGGDPKGETIEIAEKSILWLKFVVKGKETHASRPDSGTNAALIGSILAVDLHETLHKLFFAVDKMFTPPYSTFEPTKRAANVDTINIIPGIDEFYMDCRILPCYKTQDVLSEVETLCTKYENQYGVKITVTTVQCTQSPSTWDGSDIVVNLKRALKDTRSIDAKVIGIGGGTVAGVLRNKGFPCAVWSTIDETAHTYNEYCIVDNIALDALTMAALLCE